LASELLLQLGVGAGRPRVLGGRGALFGGLGSGLAGFIGTFAAPFLSISSVAGGNREKPSGNSSLMASPKVGGKKSDFGVRRGDHGLWPTPRERLQHDATVAEGVATVRMVSPGQTVSKLRVKPFKRLASPEHACRITARARSHTCTARARSALIEANHFGKRWVGVRGFRSRQAIEQRLLG